LSYVFVFGYSLSTIATEACSTNENDQKVINTLFEQAVDGQSALNITVHGNIEVIIAKDFDFVLKHQFIVRYLLRL
jgi:hypothetical protein